MSIIEQAAKRLEELARSGVRVPWAAAGLAPGEVAARGAGSDKRPSDASPPELAPARLPIPAAAALRFAARPAVASGPLRAKPSPDAPPRRSQSVTIDLERLERSNFLVPRLSRTELAEEFRRIKLPLLRNASGGSAVPRGSLSMVTSALPGEGKTFCAFNLAVSIATEIDRSVLLVDADVVRPSLPSLLGLEGRRGLLDVGRRTTVPPNIWPAARWKSCSSSSPTGTTIVSSSSIRLRCCSSPKRGFLRRTSAK